MELYEAIFYRKSIKNYSGIKIKESLMEEVKNLCRNITYLNTNLNIKAHVIERGHLIHFSTENKIEVKAPHYILVTSNKGENYLENIGFALQKVILGLTSLGIGTCWLSCTLDREDIEEFVDLDKIDIQDENYENKIENPYSLIAFGYPEEGERLFRSSSAISDREKMSSMCKEYDKRWENILEAARVSPSIKNYQPWKFTSKEYGFDMFEQLPKKKFNIDRDSKISMGVALRNFDVACKEYGMDVEYAKLDIKEKRKNHYFISIIDKNIKNNEDIKE